MDFSFIEDERQRVKAQEDYDNSVQAKIDEEVEGLKNKNEQLLNEKKSTQKMYEDFQSKYADIDPEKAKEALEIIKNTEKKELLDSGKLEEYLRVEIQNKTSDIETKFQEKLNQEKTEKSTYFDKAKRYEDLYKNKLMDDALRLEATRAGVKQEENAISDFILRGKEIFTLAEDGKLEARNADGSLAKMENDKILTPKEWAHSQKKERSYWFPASNSMGATGSTLNAEFSNDIFERMDAASKAGDMTLYRSLKAKLKK